ncbi:DNA-binding transcriptional regulator, AcrR family [Actinomadura madurae]|uniref:DNA-binding transcriptional regulator, AcrR family n=1 Tax=Actinomadura madurae TaxID=1993 RepID=A0A1I5LCI9_9ACTN|nr:TetR/AcrR family transcriptional regulator [Actinomadura madurae]SFO94912.1 DNA-binding transcriptional regulator, AcrR family [Actinomadura madurae]
MPKNMQEIPHAERRAKVLAEAIRQFGDNGYRATSVTAVAKALGLSSAAVHWYFPSKDDLFAEVLTTMFQAATARASSSPESGGDPRAELISVLEELEPYKSLVREAYERLNTSPTLQAAYSEMLRWVDDRLLRAIAQRVPEDADVDLLADTAHVLLEGLLVSVRKVDRPMADMIDLLIDPLAAAAAARSRSGDAGS